MYFCYIDESGNPEKTGNSSHYILAGISILDDQWRNCDTCVADFKRKWQIEDSEIHTAWLLRQIVEQTKIQDFEKLPANKRRSEVAYLRNQALLKAQQSGNKKAYAQLSKNYRNTDKYTHLTLTERQNLALEFSKIIRVFKDNR